MRIEEWERRYRTRERASEDFSPSPTPLVAAALAAVRAGRALDLACGTGRNALWLAQHDWQVTAVDGAGSAIDALNSRAREAGLAIETQVADLEKLEFAIEPNAWDAILDCYYLQRSLFPAIRAGVKPGGLAIVVVHITEPGEQPSYKRAAPGELRSYFNDWDILHYREGAPEDPAHKRAAAELVARKPAP